MTTLKVMLPQVHRCKFNTKFNISTTQQSY